MVSAKTTREREEQKQQRQERKWERRETNRMFLEDEREQARIEQAKEDRRRRIDEAGCIEVTKATGEVHNVKLGDPDDREPLF